MSVYVDAQGTYNTLSSGAGTAWSNTSGQNGYALYPGAQVLSVYANGAVGNIFTLMPNTVVWANTDAIEEPQHPANGAELGTWNIWSWWPLGSPWGPQLSFNGNGIGLGTRGLTIQNNVPSTHYIGGGGNIYQPNAAFVLQGPWAQYATFSGYGPSTVGLDFLGQTWGTVGNVYPIQVWPASGNADYLAYGQSTKTWTVTTGSQGGSYSFGPTLMSVPGHFGSSSADAAGSVTISSSTSATVNFGTSYNSAPKCVVTPTSDPTSVGAYWVTSTTSGFTVNVHTSGTITFNYVCVGI
jgi:hypothetical protein